MKKVITILIALFFTASVNAFEIAQRGISSPEAKEPSRMSREPSTPDEPFDQYDQYNIDNFEIREPSEPYLLIPFDYMDKAYEEDVNLPPTPEYLKDDFPRIECPSGMQCGSSPSSILHEPPYIPTEPYIVNIR